MARPTNKGKRTKTFDEVVKEQQKTNEKLDKIDRNIDNFITLWYSSKLDEMEEMRERISPTEKIRPTPNSPVPERVEGLNFGLGALVAGVTAAVAGFTLGFSDFLNGILKVLKIDLGKIFTTWSKTIRNLFTGIGSKANTLFLRMGSLLDPILSFFSKMKSFLGIDGVITKVITKISGMFQPIKAFAQSFGATFTKFFGFFRLLGRAFLPLTAAIEVGSSIMNEITKFEDSTTLTEKFLAILKGVTKGIANIVLIPFDLLKGGLEWILDNVGLENYTTKIKSFSFKDSFEKIIDLVSNFLSNVGKGAIAAISAVIPGGDTPMDAFVRQVVSVGDRGSKNLRDIRGRNSDRSIEDRLDRESKINLTRISGDKSRQNITDEIIRQTNSAVNNNVNIVTTNQVSAPTTTQNNVSNTQQFALSSPVTNNGTRSNAYSW